MRRLLAAVCAVLCLAAAAPSSADEARARALFAEIRCVVCQNESIDSSQAQIAADLRSVVREQVAAGRSDEEIRVYLVKRYGEFVLFRPRLSLGNAALWFAPFVIVAGGLAAVVLRSWRTAPVPVLTPEEAARVDALKMSEPNDGKVT